MTDAWLLPVDPVLRHLDVLLDADRMAPILERHVFARPTTVERCKIERVKYKPGKACLVVYRLDCRDMAGGDMEIRRFSARSYEPGGSASRFQKALRALSGSVSGQPISHVPALDLVVWAFPHDRKMTNLSALVSEAVEPTSGLGRALDVERGPGRLLNPERTLVHYAPEHTCCVRLDGQWRSTGRNAGQPLTLYGKAYYDDQGARAADVMAQLSAHGSDGRAGPRTPRVIHYDTENRILWQEGLPGRTLAERLPSPTWLAKTGKAIAKLHRSMIVCRRRIATPMLLQGLDRTAGLVAIVCPGQAKRMTDVIDRLKQRAPNEASGPIATLHGDFHAKNVLVDDGEVALIDLDNVALGPPLHDIGSFAAALIHSTLVTGCHLGEVLVDIDRFLQSYRQCAPWPALDEAVAWYAATALLQERVYRTITRLKPGRLGLIGDLIDLADGLQSEGFGVLDRRQPALA